MKALHQSLSTCYRKAMTRGGTSKKEPPILPWRLTVGIFLHFAVPAYGLYFLCAFLLSAHPPADAENGVRWLLRASGAFLIGFAILTTIAGAGAAALDPWLRRARSRRAARAPGAPARMSATRVSDALDAMVETDWGEANTRVAIAVARLRDGHWDHGDADVKRLALDLRDAAAAFVPAYASAPPASRREISDLAAHALEHLASALDNIGSRKSRLDEGDARTIAHLINLRYGDARHPVSLDRPKDEA